MEFATGIVFQKQSGLQAIYERLTRDRHPHGYQNEMGNRFNARIEGPTAPNLEFIFAIEDDKAL